MVKRTSFEHDDCPIARSLDAIGDWWSMLIIREALFGVSRFGEFQKKLGLAKNILTVRLARAGRSGYPENRACRRRQRVSGISADAEGTRCIPDPGRLAAMERGIR